MKQTAVVKKKKKLTSLQFFFLSELSMLFHGKQADKALTFKAFYPRLSLAGSTVNQVFLPSFCKVITYSLHLQRLANYELALVQKPCHHA